MRRLIILAAVALGMPGSLATPAGTTQSVAMKGIAFAPKQVTGGCHINREYYPVLVNKNSRTKENQRLGLCKN